MAALPLGQTGAVRQAAAPGEAPLAEGCAATASTTTTTAWATGGPPVLRAADGPRRRSRQAAPAARPGARRPPPPAGDLLRGDARALRPPQAGHLAPALGCERAALLHHHPGGTLPPHAAPGVRVHRPGGALRRGPRKRRVPHQ